PPFAGSLANTVPLVAVFSDTKLVLSRFLIRHQPRLPEVSPSCRASSEMPTFWVVRMTFAPLTSNRRPKTFGPALGEMPLSNSSEALMVASAAIFQLLVKLKIQAIIG